MAINIPDDKKYFFDQLFRYVYETTQISYAYTKSNDNILTKYYNRNNMWYANSKETGECNGYSKCDFKDYETTKSPIFYKFKHEPGKISYMVEKLDFDDDLLQNLQSRFFELHLETKKKIIIMNRAGINDDHRGSDHTKIKLPFHTKIILTPVDEKIPFEDFIRACFDIKSHKFDLWYELYCGINVVDKFDDSILIQVKFDHGS